MTEWQGALLRAQLQRYPAQHRIREERGALLDAELEQVPGVRPQSGDPRMDSRARYCYVLHYNATEFAGLSLAGFEAALAAEGIEFGGSYPSLNKLELFRAGNFAPRLRVSAPQIDYGELSLPHAEHAAANTIWLSHPMLLAEGEEVLDVVRAIARIQANAAAVAKRADATGLRAGRLAGATHRLGDALRSRRS
jgi:dTDP-4-amino-4,6-dideoxygalactose transaminase